MFGLRNPKNKKLAIAAQPMALSVIEPADSDNVEMFVYGYIGEDYWGDSERQNTAENVADALTRLVAAGKKRINMRIQSYGGVVFEGNGIITAMQRAQDAGVVIATYNDGIAASMAAVIWAAGTERYMSTNALLMLHSASDWAWGNAKEMRATASFLDAVDTTIKATLIAKLGVTQPDIDVYFDGTDHWLSHEQVTNLGWITDSTDAAPAPSEGAPEPTVVKATFDNLRAKAATQRGAKAAAAIINPISNSNNDDVTLQKVRDAIADGSLSADDLRGLIEEPSTAPPAEPTPQDNDVAKALASLRRELDETRASLTALSGGPTRVPATSDPVPVDAADADITALLKEANSTLAALKPLY